MLLGLAMRDIWKHTELTYKYDYGDPTLHPGHKHNWSGVGTATCHICGTRRTVVDRQQ